MNRFAASALSAALLTTLLAPATSARPLGWDRGPYGDRDFPRAAPQVEGKVEVATFLADNIDPASLGQGTIAMVPAATGAGSESDGSLKVFEAALLDQLARHGYDTQSRATAAAQTAEVRIVREVAVPEEAPHKPVSGEMTMGVSNRGSMMGMAVAVDLSKPRKALMATRLEARIRNAADGTVIWEGRAEMRTRDESKQWTEQRIAEKLAGALLDRFPSPRSVALAR